MTVRSDVCIKWDDGRFNHQCRYHPGHKVRHSCPCGASKPLAPALTASEAFAMDAESYIVPIGPDGAS